MQRNKGGKMMKKFVEPKIEIITFDTEDIIVTSDGEYVTDPDATD